LNFQKRAELGISNYLAWVQSARERLTIWMVRNINTTLLTHLFVLIKWLGFRNKKDRANEALSQENMKCLINGGKYRSFIRSKVQQEILETAATCAFNKSILKQLNQCSVELDNIVSKLHAQGNPVIMAPLHMLSDTLAAMVASNVTPMKATVIILSHSGEKYPQEICQSAGFNIEYCPIDVNNGQLTKQLKTAYTEGIKQKTNIVIFPDITPYYTGADINKNKNMVACKIFNRPAHLHQGVIRFSKMLNAKVVFYYLHYDKGIKIHIYTPVEAVNVELETPKIIENAIKRSPESWLLWHQHFLYF